MFPNSVIPCGLSASGCEVLLHTGTARLPSSTAHSQHAWLSERFVRVFHSLRPQVSLLRVGCSSVFRDDVPVRPLRQAIQLLRLDVRNAQFRFQYVKEPYPSHAAAFAVCSLFVEHFPSVDFKCYAVDDGLVLLKHRLAVRPCVEGLPCDDALVHHALSEDVVTSLYLLDKFFHISCCFIFILTFVM